MTTPGTQNPRSRSSARGHLLLRDWLRRNAADRDRYERYNPAENAVIDDIYAGIFAESSSAAEAATVREELPSPPDRAPDLDEDFRNGLSPQWWIPHYLPHWTTPHRSEARYRLTPEGLQLRIEADQLDWRPEDAPLRVSNIQTGNHSGPLGSSRGTHRHREDGLRVRTETPQQLLFAPYRGRVDVTVTASRDEGCMMAAWLVGSEHLAAEDSGEICIFEIDADKICRATVARSGVKAHDDARLVTDMAETTVPLDATRPHTWTVIWDRDETIIGCQGLVLRRIAQAPTYPLFLMIDLFEIGPASGQYPKTAMIHRVQAWSSTEA